MKIELNIKVTDAEITKILKTIKILVDSREQKNNHILKYFDSFKIPYEVRKLEFGDYSFEFEYKKQNYSFEKKISIERKASLEELSNNFTKGRQRIKNEFIAKADSKLILLIENSSYSDLIRGNYNTKFNAKSYLGSLNSYKYRYNFEYFFIENKDTGNYIFYQFKTFLKEFLKK